MCINLLLSSILGLIAIISGLTTRLTVDLSETIGRLYKIRILVLFVSRTIDRRLSSSTNFHRRNLSSFKYVQRSLVMVTLFSLLLNCSLLYCYEVNVIGTPAKCYGYSEPSPLYTDPSFTCGTILVP